MRQRPLPDAINDYGRKPNRTRHLHNGVDDGDEEVAIPPATNMFQTIVDFVSLVFGFLFSEKNLRCADF
jgi:hypothetical protein